jgi:hypothetical protein
MHRIYVFDKAHETGEITLARQGKRDNLRLIRGQKLKPFTGAAKRLVAVTFRQTGRDLRERGRAARILGLADCDMAAGTASLISSPK